MLIRAKAVNGDVKPILHISDMESGAKAVAILVENRLDFYAGDWWENEEWGSLILKMLEQGRLSEADAQTISVYLTQYVRDTPGVSEVQDVVYTISGRNFSWQCTVLTGDGSATVLYNL